MDESERFELVSSNIVELLTKEEIKGLLKSGKKLRAYVGYEPSGSIHLGHVISINKLIDLQKAGIGVVVLLADLHAYLNNKGSLSEILEVAEYNKKCFKALGLDDSKTEYVLGSEIQLEGEYFLNVQKLALTTTMLRAKRSMDVISRVKENPPVATVLYPLMQVADMVALNVDIAVGGMDQRKIHMLARDNLSKIGHKSPSFIHLPIIHGLDGDEKMSSSKNNFISIDDSPEVIRRKIENAYCRIGDLGCNPVLELFKYHVFPRSKEVLVERPKKHGGDLIYNNYIKMEEDYTKGAVHPADLKSALSRELIEILSSVRSYFGE